ncbi:MAG: DsbA family protein [Microscillaceae bacterium]|nr:DsbA family protein [Microscillaceae bacterium]
MQKPEIIYVGDPLCSWCWGAAPELSLLKERFKAQMDFKILLGGLRPGTNTVMSDHQKLFLKKHWLEIESLTGQKFNYQILERHDFIYDTEPPARAVFCMRAINPDLEFDFFKAIQKAFYVENKNTNSLETYLDICEEFFMERDIFEKLFFTEDAQSGTLDDFEQTRMLGVMGFPTVLLKIGEKYKLITRGYEKYEAMEQKLLVWLNTLVNNG